MARLRALGATRWLGRVVFTPTSKASSRFSLSCTPQVTMASPLLSGVPITRLETTGATWPSSSRRSAAAVTCWGCTITPARRTPEVETTRERVRTELPVAGRAPSTLRASRVAGSGERYMWKRALAMPAASSTGEKTISGRFSVRARAETPARSASPRYSSSNTFWLTRTARPGTSAVEAVSGTVRCPPRWTRTSAGR